MTPEEKYISHVEGRHLSAEGVHKHVDITMSEVVGMMSSLAGTADPGLAQWLEERGRAFGEAMEKYLADKNVESRTPRRFVEIRPAYLVKFVNPERMYPVTYQITQSGEKLLGDFDVKGADLTEKQIGDLFEKQLL